MKIIVVGSGNAAFCAAIAALEKGAQVEIAEKAPENEAGGNSRYTAGAMRFCYNSKSDIMPLLLNPEDEKLKITEFGAYPVEKFKTDLLQFNDGQALNLHQNILVDNSYATMLWLAEHNIKFEPIYSRQSFEKDGKFIFWGGLTLEAQGEGVGLVDAQKAEFLKLGGKINYATEALSLLTEENKVVGVKCQTNNGEDKLYADAVILACGGFEANPEMRRKIMGEEWGKAKVRGTKHNYGKGIEMALEIGATFYGNPEGCHAVPMDMNMPNYGNPDIPFKDRKNYRKICYFLGLMLNVNGERFVDEGINFRNYTYAQFGKAILNQPENKAWQIFDKKVDDLLYKEYKFWDASFVEANTLEELIKKIEGINSANALKTLNTYNDAVNDAVKFDPTILDGKTTNGLKLNKTNWANKLDTPPFKAYPVTCGITFTYSGLKVDAHARVLNENSSPIEALYACGELVGGVFNKGYPGGSGLTSGAVFGRKAGFAAAMDLKNNVS